MLYNLRGKVLSMRTEMPPGIRFLLCSADCCAFVVSLSVEKDKFSTDFVTFHLFEAANFLREQLCQGLSSFICSICGLFGF